MKTNITLIVLCTMCGILSARNTLSQWQEPVTSHEVTLNVSIGTGDDDITKEAKKMAKEYTKEGWRPLPGKPSLERQFIEALRKQEERDETGEKVYYYASNTAVGKNQDAAQVSASTHAREAIGRQVGEDITAHVKNNMTNEEISSFEAQTINAVINEAEHVFSMRMGRNEVVLEAYRMLANNQCQVMIGIVCQSKNALSIAYDEIASRLRKAGMEPSDNFDNIFGKR